MQGILPSVAYNPAMLGILAPKQTGPSMGGKNPTAATPPVERRQRINPLRVLDNFLFTDASIGGSIDAERERLRTEAMRPQAMQRQQQLRTVAERMGPAAMIAFETNPEQFGSRLAEQFAPQVISPGAIQSIAGTGARIGAPSYTESGDTILERDPVSRAVNPVFTRQTPSISERTAQTVAETGRINALNVPVAADARLVNPLTGDVIAEGYRAPEIQTIAPGASATVFQDGVPVTTVQGNAPASASGPQTFDPQTRGALSTASTAAGTARRRLAEAREFIALNRENPTGAGLWGPLGMAGRAMNPAYSRMDSIAASLIPKEREPGSGPMSDRDVLLYGRAQIGLDRPGPANEAIANAAMAQAQRDIEYSAFLDEYAQRNGNLLGAGEDWQAYVNANPLLEEGPNGLIRLRPQGQVQEWRDFFGWGPRQRGGQGQQRQQTQPRAATGPIAEDANGNRVQWNGSAWVPI